MRLFALSFLLSLPFAMPAHADLIESAYVDISGDGCVWDNSVYNEASGVCKGHRDFPMYLIDSDGRMFTAFGPVDDAMEYPGGFRGFNDVNDIVEWRLEQGHPFATILRWYPSNYDEATEELVYGQVLVVSTIADPDTPERGAISCPIAYVDALANDNANALARQVADLAARSFRCGVDTPVYVGVRGPLSGKPNDISPDHY